MLETERRRRRDFAAARCPWCGRTIPDGEGTYFAHLRISLHSAGCADAVRGYERVYDRSPRGRWRPAREMLALIYERAPAGRER